ncbi:hypothetical protein [Cellulomonas sp. NTE-D12]|uniref:hypothetical protein n=1 Tax=Cellulomonas sp. NTE-D12 TaxID=2962632 RepID=UPI003081C7E1|nr:hypothetical protein CELD12_26330 [Cellulomonas sp. NTE-D12]
MTTTRHDPVANAIIAMFGGSPPCTEAQPGRSWQPSARAATSPGRPPKPRPPHRPQPQCGTCNHPASFHSAAKTRCRASGCRCQLLTDNPPTAPALSIGMVVVLTDGTASSVAAVVGALSAGWRASNGPTQTD